MFTIDVNDSSLVGHHSPDPLRFAFTGKRAPHVGAAANMLASDKVQISLDQAFESTTTKQAPRCLYIHIPFCRVRCTYCNFFQYASAKSLIDEYFVALEREILWKSQQAWTQSVQFQAVYVGGGTPTDLSAQQLQRLGKLIHQHFQLTPDCEVTLEGRINRFDDAKFESALAGGFNRFSFGVQSFNTLVRRSAKRLNDGDEVIQRLQHFVSYNSAPIVLDLLYGLPHQSLEIWQQDLEDYLETGADGVDLYQLLEMQNLPMNQMIEQGKLPAAGSTELKASMYQMGVNFMAKHHQRRLSINHWASSNRERSIYNSLAKTTAEILPIGAGAGGNISGLHFMQSRNMETYIEAIKQIQHPVMGVMLGSENAALNNCLKASFDQGVIINRQVNTIANFDLIQAVLPLIQQWHKNGLVQYDQDYVWLTLAGQFWSTTLASNLLKVIQQHQLKAA